MSLSALDDGLFKKPLLSIVFKLHSKTQIFQEFFFSAKVYVIMPSFFYYLLLSVRFRKESMTKHDNPFPVKMD